MSEMVEQVARALAAREWPHVGGADGENLVKGTPNWRFKVDDARAAIAAMRVWKGPITAAGERELSQGQSAASIFNVMLDAALATPPQFPPRKGRNRREQNGGIRNAGPL